MIYFCEKLYTVFHKKSIDKTFFRESILPRLSFLKYNIIRLAKYLVRLVIGADIHNYDHAYRQQKHLGSSCRITKSFQEYLSLICSTYSWVYIHQNFSWINQILQIKKPSFLDINVKVIGSNIHTIIYDKHDDFRFTVVNSGWVVMFLDSHHAFLFHILQLIRFAICCTSVFDFHSKNLQITSKLLTRG